MSQMSGDEKITKYFDTKFRFVSFQTVFFSVVKFLFRFATVKFVSNTLTGIYDLE